MKRYTRYIIVLIIISLGCIFFWIFKSSDAAQYGAAGLFSQNMSGADVASEASSAAAAETLKRNQEERIQITFNAIEGSNQPIDFWGKVLDQDDRPVTGVRVRFSYSIEHGTMLAVRWGAQENRGGNVTTDAAGNFYIGGIRGHVLEIESLIKEGYFSTKRDVLNYDYYGSTSQGRFKPSQSAPILFAMIDETAVKDIAKYGYELDTSFHLIGDGAPVRWNLRAERPDPNGELQLTFRREPLFLSNSGERSKWELKIELVGGGIIATSPADVIYRAPENGYLTFIDYPKTEQKRGYRERAFYFRTSANQYGLMHLELHPDDKGESARLYIQSWLNSSGGRLLEAGPNP